MSDHVKLLVQRFKNPVTNTTVSGAIQNSAPRVVSARVHRDGLRAVDSGEFVIPTGVPVSEGDVVKWIQDDADVENLRSCYLFQGSLKDEGGWEADGTNDNLTDFSSNTQRLSWDNITSGKFKGLLKWSGSSNYKYSVIPNKLMYTNKIVSGGSRTENVHNFDGNFDIFMWITAGGSFANDTLLYKGAATNGQRIRIHVTSSGRVDAEVEDASNNEVLLNTGSKVLKASSANLIRFRRSDNKFDLWLVNGSEDHRNLFLAPDDTETNSSVGKITTTDDMILSAYESSGTLTGFFNGIINSVRIYCGGTLGIIDARNIFKARASPLVMKFAGTVWKIKDTTNGKKIWASGFGKAIPETTMDTTILDDSYTADRYTPKDGEDSNNDLTTGTSKRTLNVYTQQPIYNIIYSMFKKINEKNTAANSVDYGDFSVQLVPNVSEIIGDFVAEGNFLSIIKMLMLRGIGAGSSGSLSFYISPRGVCLIDVVGIDRGITFENNPYNIQVSSADDTFVANDITIFGRIPTKTVVKEVSGFELGVDGAIDISDVLGKSIPVAVRVYDDTANEWLKNKTTGLFNIGRETKSLQIQSYNSGATATRDLKIHVDFEDIETGATGRNLIRAVNDASIAKIGRYKKRMYMPQFTGGEGVDWQYLINNIIADSKDIKKRYTVKAPFLVNFVRENYKVTVKNAIKGINATNQVIKSVYWHYPKNETIIEVGEHEPDAYDLVVSSNEAIHSLTAQSLKSMNREL